VKVYESLWTWIDGRSNIAFACGRGCRSLVEIRGCNIWGFVPLWCPPPLRRVALFSHNGWLHRDVRIPVFYPASRLACAITSLSPRILNLCVQRTFKHAFHPHTSPCQRFSVMVTSQSTDRASLKWLRQQYTVYGFRFHVSLQGRAIADNTYDIQTGGGSRSLRILTLSDTDYCMILLVLGEWQYRVIVLIAQHLTCVALIDILLPSPPQ